MTTEFNIHIEDDDSIFDLTISGFNPSMFDAVQKLTDAYLDFRARKEGKE